jgi:hypothetical protein
MSRLKNPIIALTALMILASALAALLPLIGLGQAVPGPAKPPGPVKPVPKYPFGRPGNYYLTKTKHNGAQAVTACAAGYHMASIWEIHDPSALRYNMVFGYTTDDSGLGPPIAKGWIRTGRGAFGGDSGSSSDLYVRPLTNCVAWTSADATDFGKLVNLYLPGSEVPPDIPNSGIHIPEPDMPPWQSWSSSCNTNNRVWCVQD